MDINELKKEAVETKKETERLEALRNRTLERFDDFKNTCNKISALIGEEVASRKLELAGEFREFFENNGFVVEYADNGKYIATFEETVVILKDENPDEYENGQLFSFEIPNQQKREGIMIKAERENEDKLIWKNNLRYKGDIILFENVNKVISSIGNIEELELLHSKINDNTDWYEKTIQDFEDVKFVYAVYRTEEEFDTFQEVFNAL